MSFVKLIKMNNHSNTVTIQNAAAVKAYKNDKMERLD